MSTLDIVDRPGLITKKEMRKYFEGAINNTTALKANSRRQGRKSRMTAAKLWCINIPAPDEHHAAPNESAARHMAERHNEAMQAYFAKNPPKDDFSRQLQTGCLATAVLWPWDAESHAEGLQSFDAAEWGWSESGDA